MKPTGKCKKDFERWYNEDDLEIIIPCGCGNNNSSDMSTFYDSPESMQYGVYKTFFNSKKIHIVCYPSFMDVAEQSGVRYTWLIDSEIDEYQCSDKTALGFLTDIEAMEAVIEKANNLYNERNN